MKAKLLLLALFSLVILNSCSEDDDNGGNADTELFVRFNANGTDYDFADPVIAQSLNVTINGNELTNGVITESISIWLPIDFTTGTFQLTGDFGDPGDHKIFYDSEDLGIDGLAPTTGEVTITSITADYIEGTFFFSGTDNGVDVTVTNGSFRSFTID